MEKLKAEILRIKRHKLEYYKSHLTLVEDYIDEKPDISIETCKALIEGISKLSLHLLKQEPLDSHGAEKLTPLCRRALEELQKGRGYSDAEMCKRLASVVHYIGEVRNEHSDISHGRASLKNQISDGDFADLIIGVTDSLCTYMLRRLDKLSDPYIDYEENEDFNRYLDTLYPLDGKLRYSLALFQQEPESYEIMLGDYQIEQENVEE